jgi:hypothetical protein
VLDPAFRPGSRDDKMIALSGPFTSDFLRLVDLPLF